MEQRIALIQVDFANNTIIDGASASSGFKLLGDFNGKRHKIDEELKKKFLSTKISEFWNTDKDLLEFFQYFNDGTYFCQRKRVKYDFSTESTYLQTYNFNGANSPSTTDQEASLYGNIFFPFYLFIRQAALIARCPLDNLVLVL